MGVAGGCGLRSIVRRGHTPLTHYVIGAQSPLRLRGGIPILSDIDRIRCIREGQVKNEMKKDLFDKLLESVTQMGEISRGERTPSREFTIDADDIKALRAKTGLSQPRFALLMQVEVSTLRNWEQGRRAPTGPAKALLKAIRNDPEHVLAALAG